MEIYVIASAEFEFEPLKNIARSSKIKFHFISFGIGIINASINVQQLSNKLRDKHVIYIGTCGIFSAFERTSLLQATEVRWLPTSDRTGHSQSIENLHPSFMLPSSNIRLPTCSVITSPTISLSDYSIPAVQEKLPANQNIVENLELYPIAKELRLVVKRIDIILATTNSIGPTARSQWKENYKEAAITTAKWIMGEYR